MSVARAVELCVFVVIGAVLVLALVPPVAAVQISVQREIVDVSEECFALSDALGAAYEVSAEAYCVAFNAFASAISPSGTCATIYESLSSQNLTQYQANLESIAERMGCAL